MDLITTRMIPMEQPLPVCRAEAAVEGEMMLPGGLREEAHVLYCHAAAAVEKTECLQDRVNVSGRVVFHVLYTQGDPKKVRSVEAVADFTHPCTMMGAAPRCDVHAVATVSHAGASVQSGRMAMGAQLILQVAGVCRTPVEAAVETEDALLQTRMAEASLQRTVAQGAADVLLREEFTLPKTLNVADTLFASAAVQVTDVSGGLGRAGVSGQVTLECVHAADDPARPLVTSRHSFPLEQQVTLTGEGGDLLHARAVVKDVAVASQDAGDGSRVLRAEVLMGLEAFSDRRETVSLLQDAYTLSGDALRTESRQITARNGFTADCGAESCRATLLLPDSAMPVRTVLTSFALPREVQLIPSGDRLMAEGRLEATVLYLSDDGETPYSATVEAPFETIFTLPQGDVSTLMAEAVEVSPVTSDRLELRCVLRLITEGAESRTLTVVSDAHLTPADAPVEDMVLYFAQPGETLWDIARRYRVTEDSVRQMNPGLDQDALHGRGVIVWRRDANA